MLASIDSPQGDQVDRMAAATATGTANVVIIAGLMGPTPASFRLALGGEAGVAGSDAGRQQFGINPLFTVGVSTTARSGNVNRGVTGRLSNETLQLVPPACCTLTDHSAVGSVNKYEIRRARDFV